MSKWAAYVAYDETSPSFLRWVCDRGNGVGPGDVAGSCCGTDERWSFGLTAFGIKKRWYNHRVIWELHNGDIPTGMEIDHWDGDYWNNAITNLRCVPPKLNRKNMAMSSRNSTGATGVSRKVVTCKRSGEFVYWVAHWVDLDGRRRQVNFSVTSLGEDVAMAMAMERRNLELQRLKESGAGYTDRHGFQLKKEKSE